MSKFANSDLNALSKMGFLDELISGIKTGKEASVFLGKNSEGYVGGKDVYRSAGTLVQA